MDDVIHDTSAPRPVKYGKVNGAWPEGTNDGRDIIPTPQEAISGAKRLYRVAMGRPWGKRPVKLTSGNRRTWIAHNTLIVNPNEKRKWSARNGGWHEIVHSISHYAAWRKYNEAHGMRHAYIERTLIEYVVNNGWLDGSLKREPKAKAPIDIQAVRQDRLTTRLKAWESKRKRAETAIKKIERQLRYYERKAAAGVSNGG